VIRAPGSHDISAADADTFEVSNSIGSYVKDLRKTLSSEGVAPVTRQRAKGRLIEDLRQLAPIGSDLYTKFFVQAKALVRALDERDDDPVVHISRPTTSSFTFPWSFLYDISLDSSIDVAKLQVCPLVQEWNGKNPLVEGEPRRCPESRATDHSENLLCPFGFWGFRYGIEVLTMTKNPVPEIPVLPSATVAVAKTLYDIDNSVLDTHIQVLRNEFESAFPTCKVKDEATKAAIRTLVATDIPLIYFYCHGEPYRGNVYLGVGKREYITPKDFVNWVNTSWKKERRIVWDRVRPLVFINACQSLDITPESLLGYLESFVGAGGAAGVIGTEVKVAKQLAMEAAEVFFHTLIQPDMTAERAMHALRMHFLRLGNLFGLLYTPYCWADLALVRSAE
jgi:hypothetical protein